MESAVVTVTIDGKEDSFGIRPLELAELVARRRGFDIVDCEPTDSGWKIMCTSWAVNGIDHRTVTARGTTLDHASTNLVKAIY